MIFKLIPGAHFNASSLEDEQIYCIESLLVSASEKKHIVLAEEAVISAIKANPDEFGKKANSFQHFPRFEHRALLNLVSVFVEINLSEDIISEIGKREIGSGVQYKIVSGYKNFTQSQGPSLVLGENLIDAYFFELISHHYLNGLKMDALWVNLVKDMGGGDTTIKAFQENRQSQKLCLCLIDTDKKHPNGREGDTSKKFNKYLTENPTGIDPSKFSMALKINAHESEALIPTDILEEIYGLEMISPIKDFESRCKISKLYIDHKKGHSCKALIELDVTHNKAFWSPIIMEPLTGKPSSKVICSPACQEQYHSPAIKGLGENVLENSIQRIREKNYEEVNFTLNTNDQLKKEWDTLGKLVASWGMASNLSKHLS